MAYKDKEKKREWDRKYYQANKSKRKEDIRLNGLKRHKEIRKWMAEYKSQLKCQLCPENSPFCMDFHHINPEEKEITIARAIQIRWSKTRILKEINKCIVLCANCHRKLHAGKKEVKASIV